MLPLLLAACATTPPQQLNDGCAIFREKNDWYGAASRASRKWGVPVSVQLAIIYQESRFRDNVKPPRDRLLGVIPWFRSSSAYGYAQAQDGTWAQYIRATGNRGADRDDFDDATDFIGWYVNESHRRLGIARNDAYRQYLAYHEGQGGYARRTYLKKRWLIRVAHAVSRRADRYRRQVAGCREELAQQGWHLWPF